jgi:hypothetical protein
MDRSEFASPEVGRSVMRRLLLCFPVLILGLPLAVYLLLVSGAQSARNTVADVPAPVISDQGAALPTPAQMEKLAADDPVAFLEACIRRYDREVKGYSLTMQKQERLDGKLLPKEIIEVWLKEQPFSVYMHWLEGARKADSVVYVKGENNDMLLVHPAGLAGRFVKVVEREVAGEEAKASGRYPISQSGIKNGTLRTFAGWMAAQKRGKLQVEYLGEHKIKEAGDRVCYKLHRTYDQTENDGVTDLTIYIDKATWLQVGSVVKGENNKLIGEYFFRDIRLNPEFRKDQFERAILER